MHRTDTAARGFSLIELMVVVSIISILTAIAVPNFQDAQTRSKVTRTIADMRTLTTALETYRIDENKYPIRRFIDEERNNNVPQSWKRLEQMKALTTPIAYLTYLPADVFETRIPAPNNVIDFYDPVQTAWMVNWNKGFRTRFHVSPEEVGWTLVSVGPDGFVGDQNFGGQSVAGWPIAPTEALYSTYFVPYDPTNGTISTGNIFVGSSGGVDQTGDRLFYHAVKHVLN